MRDASALLTCHVTGPGGGGGVLKNIHNIAEQQQQQQQQARMWDLQNQMVATKLPLRP